MILAAARAALSCLRSLPWQVWAAAALVAALWLYGKARYDAGVAAERARWEAAQAEADRQAREAQEARDRAAEAVNDEAAQRAAEATTEIRTETAAAVERVRYVTRTVDVPAGLDRPFPDGVLEELGAAVRAANAARDPVRAGRDP